MRGRHVLRLRRDLRPVRRERHERPELLRLDPGGGIVAGQLLRLQAYGDRSVRHVCQRAVNAYRRELQPRGSRWRPPHRSAEHHRAVHRPGRGWLHGEHGRHPRSERDGLLLSSDAGRGLDHHELHPVVVNRVGRRSRRGRRRRGIVAYTGDLSVVALTLKAGTWKPLWATSTANPDGLATSAGADLAVHTDPTLRDGVGSPSIHDVNNDGKAEIVVEGNVINGQTGALLDAAPADYAGYSVGIPAVRGQHERRHERGNDRRRPHVDVRRHANAWTDVASYSQATTSNPGWAGVADFNPYDGSASRRSRSPRRTRSQSTRSITPSSSA